MKLQAGAPVTGEDFFNRDAELRLLAEKVRDGTHILLSGQRRMGKTSVAKELGRRLQADGWAFLFVDVEDAESPQDVVRGIAKAAQDADLASRLAAVGRWFRDNVEELDIRVLRLKLRPSDYAWRQRGEALIEACAHHQPGVLLVLDELPIFLSRLLAREDGTQPAHQFLRWLRAQRQCHAGSPFVLLVSGSIGMAPLVTRMGMPDSINDLHPVRLRPWDRCRSVECLQRLATDSGLEADSAVLNAIYDALGLGVPHFVQSFFARLKDYAVMSGRAELTAEDVQAVYSNELLGPAGDADLQHYENRLRESLEEDTYKLAMVIQVKAATQGVYTAEAHCSLRQEYGTMPDVHRRADDALEALVNDGYLEQVPDGGHRLSFRLLEDWLRTRFRGHVPLGQRPGTPK